MNTPNPQSGEANPLSQAEETELDTRLGTLSKTNDSVAEDYTTLHRARFDYTWNANTIGGCEATGLKYRTYVDASRLMYNKYCHPDTNGNGSAHDGGTSDVADGQPDDVSKGTASRSAIGTVDDGETGEASRLGNSAASSGVATGSGHDRAAAEMNSGATDERRGNPYQE
ncbi:hypothetical protein IAT40_007528 [Kwoniella sp. CBS 6097]